MAENSEAITDRLLINPISLTGTHTIIQLPSTAPAGTYQIKVNTIGIPTETEICASYFTGSPIRVALITKQSAYSVGDSVVLSAMVFNGTSPVTNATIQAAIIDQEHPEATPVQVTMQDSGSNDAALVTASIPVFILLQARANSSPAFA